MNEMEKFDKAFADELAANPGVPPGPTALNRRTGKTTGATSVINGRKSSRRQKLLEDAGFRFNENTGRWYNPDA